mgnify:CR=1 FL=1
MLLCGLNALVGSLCHVVGFYFACCFFIPLLAQLFSSDSNCFALVALLDVDMIRVFSLLIRE